jgi:RNA polymerase sigma factor (TIGR02999 family)
MSAQKGEVTLLLERVASGDRSAEDALIQQVYLELHRIATARLRRERVVHTLQPTALVHEVYLRLCGSGQIACLDRAHFFRLAARLMRRILVDYARQRNAEKRGDGHSPVALDDVIAVSPEQCSDSLEVNALLDRLAEFSPRQASVVELRYFGGLTDEEIASAIGKNVRTVRRDWAMARAWFRQQMKQG